MPTLLRGESGLLCFPESHAAGLAHVNDESVSRTRAEVRCGPWLGQLHEGDG